MGNRATSGVLPKRTVYRWGSRYVAVYRVGGRQRKEFAATFAEARTIKLARDAEAREARRGRTLHAYALAWARKHAGCGHDAVREQTRVEYQRLLAIYALGYFAQDIRLGDLDRRAFARLHRLANGIVPDVLDHGSLIARSATRSLRCTCV